MVASSSPVEWSAQDAAELQRAVDELFFDATGAASEIKGLRFSLTIADPALPDCPLIGCSEGFCTLCGYSMDEIVGRNCRFLLDPVPKELLSVKVRTVAREFSEAAKDGREYRVPPHLMEEWMPQADRPADHGVFCLQLNARKDGSHFTNMFYLRQVHLNDKIYIVGLQTEVVEGQDIGLYQKACLVLEENMAAVERLLAGKFWIASPMRRQDLRDVGDGYRPPQAGAVPISLSMKKPWANEQGAELQTAVDRVFGVAGDHLSRLSFSLTLADPLLPKCPLIGCSTGFSRLCGYQMDDIVGRNCRFLVDPVPQELVNDRVKRWAWGFCNAAREGRSFEVPTAEKEAWMPDGPATEDGMFCAQVNARKDGSLFENMFYLRKVELNDRPYIIGLQTGLPSGTMSGGGVVGVAAETVRACHQACKVLDEHMAEVERVLGGMFWLTRPMRRQDERDPDDGFQRGTAPSGGAAPSKADSSCSEACLSCWPSLKELSRGAMGSPRAN